MDQNERIDNLKNAMVALEKDDVVSNTAKCLEAGIGPLEIIENGLLPGLNTIGEMFESEEIFLPELMKSAQIFQGAMNLLQPKIQEMGTDVKKKGTVVIGTVKGDMHYIGGGIYTTDEQIYLDTVEGLASISIVNSVSVSSILHLRGKDARAGNNLRLTTMALAGSNTKEIKKRRVVSSS